MPAVFLVDGYNAIRRIPSLREAEQKGGLDAGRRALIHAIVASGVLRRERGIVVFDGVPEAGVPEPSPHRMLAIRYSSHPESADDSILALLESARDEGALDGVKVVTADRDLAFRASALGAAAVAPESWAPLSPPRRRKSAARLSTGSEKPAASAADVRYWLEIFGGSED